MSEEDKILVDKFGNRRFYSPKYVRELEAENKELIELLKKSNMWHKGHLELMDEFGIKYGIKRALEDDIKEIKEQLNNKP